MCPERVRNLFEIYEQMSYDSGCADSVIIQEWENFMIGNTAAKPSTPGYVLRSGEGVTVAGSGVKASRISTNGSLTLIESKTTGGAPRHVHTREDEYFYILDGVIKVRLGDNSFEAGPGAFVYLPRNIPHEWDVIGGEATLLLITAPAGLEEFLDEYHAAESQEARSQVAARYGITFL